MHKFGYEVKKVMKNLFKEKPTLWRHKQSCKNSILEKHLQRPTYKTLVQLDTLL